MRVRRGNSVQNERALGSVSDLTVKNCGTSELGEDTFRNKRMRRLAFFALLLTPFVLFVNLQGRKWLARLGVWQW